MNKIGRPTYLSNENESLIVAAADMEGDHVLLVDINFLLEQLQHVIKAIKFWCDNNDIIDSVTPQVLPPIFQVCQ